MISGELQDLLELYGPDMLWETMKTFNHHYWYFYEDETGIRIRVGDKGPFVFVDTKNGFIRYTFSASIFDQITEDLKRLVKLKVFL
jgi:hypothetical protein